MIQKIAFAALVFQSASALATTTTVTCKLSYHNGDDWESCGAVQVSDKRATDTFSHGPSGNCSDLTFLMGHYKNGAPDRDDFLIVARSTKTEENTEATTVLFPTRFPDRFSVLPHFTKRAPIQADCTVATQEQ